MQARGREPGDDATQYNASEQVRGEVLGTRLHSIKQARGESLGTRLHSIMQVSKRGERAWGRGYTV